MRFVLFIVTALLSLPACNYDQTLGEEENTRTTQRSPNSGSQNAKGCTQLVNGVDTSAYPASTFLASKSSPTKYKVCSGAFIATNAIVTAAHCIQSQDPEVIRYLGNSSVPSNKLAETYNKAKIPTKLITNGSNYIGSKIDPMNESLRRYDIAILIFSEDIAPAVFSMVNSRPSINALATLIGYGLDTFASSAPAGYTYRQQAGSNTIIPSHSVVPTSLITFDERGTSINFGDSGGPVLVGGKLAGVASSRVILSSGSDTLNLSLYLDIKSAIAQKLIAEARKAGAKIDTATVVATKTKKSKEDEKSSKSENQSVCLN